MNTRRIMSYTLGTIAMICVVQGSWIHIKAAVAQQLLQHAWSNSLTSGEQKKPWPWADVRVTARLSVPDQNLDYVVLDGGSGEAMAFGPARIASNNAAGNKAIVIGGHRDTHLRFIRHLENGDAVNIDLPDGTTMHYKVREFMIADSETDQLFIDWQEDQLVMITCYPFEAITNVGTQRYIAIALPDESGLSI